MYTFELAAYQAGHRGVCGVDEAGRGPLAGPVVAACVYLPSASIPKLAGLTDSKKLSEAQRLHYFNVIQEVALGVGLGVVSPEEIDRINILQATYTAMREAIAAIPDAGYVLVDGNRAIPNLAFEQQTIVKGDAQSYSIAAASVIAKVTRDALMVALDDEFPGYGFGHHKGYGTRAHFAALDRLGPTPLHRRSFLVNWLSNRVENPVL